VNLTDLHRRLLADVLAIGTPGRAVACVESRLPPLGEWVRGAPAQADASHLNSFNAAVQDGASLEEAALTKTFTGKMAARAGFSKVEITELRGMAGHYTNVGVTFR
jgi:hypothetical protein